MLFERTLSSFGFVLLCFAAYLTALPAPPHHPLLSSYLHTTTILSSLPGTYVPGGVKASASFFVGQLARHSRVKVLRRVRWLAALARAGTATPPTDGGLVVTRRHCCVSARSTSLISLVGRRCVLRLRDRPTRNCDRCRVRSILDVTPPRGYLPIIGDVPCSKIADGFTVMPAVTLYHTPPPPPPTTTRHLPTHRCAHTHTTTVVNRCSLCYATPAATPPAATTVVRGGIPARHSPGARLRNVTVAASAASFSAGNLCIRPVFSSPHLTTTLPRCLPGCPPFSAPAGHDSITD